jgi:hypothetical protein
VNIQDTVNEQGERAMNLPLLLSLPLILSLIGWFGLILGFVYVTRNIGIRQVLPALFVTIIGILVVTTLGSSLVNSLWLWFDAITILAILVAVIIPKTKKGRELDFYIDRSWRGAATRAWLTFRADTRYSIIMGAFLVSLLVTYFFGKLVIQEDPRGFWYGFYEAWTASLVFFLILGIAGTLVSLYRPEKDTFSQRVRILFGGRQDEAVDFISESIRKIGYYSDDVKRTYTIKQYDAVSDAFLIRV